MELNNYDNFTLPPMPTQLVSEDRQDTSTMSCVQNVSLADREETKEKTLNRFYVYLYLRENGSPYYVGKGNGNRAYSRHKVNKPPKDKCRIKILFKDLYEDESLEIEKRLIKLWGRKNNGTGILRNLTDGGEGISGFKFSEEMRLKQMYFLDKKHSEESKNKMSKSRSGKNNAMFGKVPNNNQKIGLACGRQSENNNRSRKPVKCIETGIIYPSIFEASKVTGIGYDKLGDIIRSGETYLGFTFIKVDKIKKKRNRYQKTMNFNYFRTKTGFEPYKDYTSGMWSLDIGDCVLTSGNPYEKCALYDLHEQLYLISKNK